MTLELHIILEKKNGEKERENEGPRIRLFNYREQTDGDGRGGEWGGKGEISDWDERVHLP